jgi:hypothetical protein
MNFYYKIVKKIVQNINYREFDGKKTDFLYKK